MAKKRTAKKGSGKSETKVVETPKTFKLADLAREMDKNPKAVRARFRKMYAGDNASDLPKQPVGGGSRWTYAASDRDAVVALMNSVDSTPDE